MTEEPDPWVNVYKTKDRGVIIGCYKRRSEAEAREIAATNCQSNPTTQHLDTVRLSETKKPGFLESYKTGRRQRRRL